MHIPEQRMPTSTLTRKGQTTIPKAIREYLNLRAGQKLDFVIDAEGRVVLRPATLDVRDLEGMLAHGREEAVTVEEMNRVVRRRAGQARAKESSS